jgi:ubiquinone/menaquinone biosynthesis C-methylase UbiE
MNDQTLTEEDKLTRIQMEKMVPSYDTFMRNITLGRERTFREMEVSLARIKPGDSVLEVGCGTGTLTIEAKRQAGVSGKVSAIDVIPGMIELSQRKAARANMDVTFRLGSIDDIPFSENQFDVILCSFMIFHMSEGVRVKGISEIYRVMKPGGRVLIVDTALPTRKFPRAIAKMLMGGTPHHNLQELIPMMNAVGFSDIEIAPVEFSVFGLSIIAFLRGSARKN